MDSVVARGRDFRNLIRQLGLDLNAVSQPTAKGTHAANEAEHSGVAADAMFRVCRDGERTQHLTRLAGYWTGVGINVRRATELCLAWNTRNDPPLDERKVRDTVTSIAKTHQRNHPQVDDPDTPLFDLQTANVGRFFDADPPERDWVLEDCIPMGKTALLVAPGGTGKSQLVLQLAIDIATGQQRLSPWAPGPVGQVVIVGAEDEDEEFHRRLRRLTDGGSLGVHNAHVMFAALRNNLYIVSRVAENNLMTADNGGEVIQTGFVERLADTLKPLDNLRLIVIDPVARFRGGEENSAEDTTRFIETSEKLAKLTGAAVLLVHHANKASMQGGEQSQSASRGSSALSDGVRLQINLSYATEQPHRGGDTRTLDQYLIVRITKTNYAAAGSPIMLCRGTDGVLTPTNIALVQKSRSDAQVDLLVDILQAEATLGRTYSKQKFVSAYGGTEKQFHVGQTKLKEIVDRAVAERRVEVAASKDKILTVRTPAAESGAADDHQQPPNAC